MDQTDTDEVELDTEIDTEVDAVAEVEGDPAAEAFARLEGEMALMRRAVEHLAAERPDIIIPDYGTTLGEMAGRLGEMSLSLFAIVSKPAMQMTPEDMAARMQAAATQARRDDHIALADAQRQHGEAVRTLRAFAGDVASLNEQRRRLKWAAGGGLLAGCLLWAVLPGLVARNLPASWHLPERLAARTVGEPTLWEAGTRIMRADSPEAWNALAQAAELARDNRETIDACERDARKANQPVRCTIRIRIRARSGVGG
ncbi:MAG TPA: DUF6118 family protein [Novosphingobium sp.]|nr:DUF6118 family protein [Novosphingobium sp.]